MAGGGGGVVVFAGGGVPTGGSLWCPGPRVAGGALRGMRGAVRRLGFYCGWRDCGEGPSGVDYIIEVVVGGGGLCTASTYLLYRVVGVGGAKISG